MPSSAENSPSPAPEPSQESAPQLNYPPDILRLRELIFNLESTVTLSVTEFNNAWKYLDNIYVRNQVRYGPQKTTTYYWCRLWPTKAHEPEKPVEERKRKRLCIIRGKAGHNHDISATDYKLTTAARELAAEAVAKGTRPSLVARELKNSGIGGRITSKDAWNAGNAWLNRNKRPTRQAHAPFKIEEYPKPPTKHGEVLIEVKAFGISHPELLTRQGHSTNVKFPHVMGREAVGIVAAAFDGPFRPGARVIAMIRDLLPEYPGSYAQYTRVPITHIREINQSCQLSWEHLAAFPEMLQTAWNALFRSLRLHPDDRLLIRGGTTSIGQAAACIAKQHCSFIASTTRQESRKELLRGLGVQQVLIDDGSLSQQIKSQKLEFTKVLDLVGVKTVADSLQCVRPYGIVCMAGTVGDESMIPDFDPMDVVPSTVCFTTYQGSVDDFQNFPLDTLCHQVQTGDLNLPNLRIYLPDQVGEAHRCMEENRSEGKIVVLW
ncbi:hypothetical protein BBP40_001499 [Aspergillus hancockii]|nr:hypothetical protein BBP40_001499 [Aspergillus hancockii]